MMTPRNNQKEVSEALKPIMAIITLMTAIFGVLAIFLPSSLLQPIGALVTGLVLTAILVSMRRLEWGMALSTWLAVGIVLIILHLIVSRPAMVVGKVADSSGAPVVGLKLVLTDSSGVDHKAVTDENGAFEIRNVPEGKFTILANGELLISKRVPSGWERIMASKTEIGALVYKTVGIAVTPSATVTVTLDTPTTTLIPPTNTPVPAIYTPTPLSPTDTPTPAPPTDTPTPTAPLDMAYVPASEFVMGSDKGKSDELPIHTVYLDAFFIDKTEATNAQYRKCVEMRVCDVPSDTTYYDDANYAQHPVVHVSWYDADVYCRWAGKRLPTEAEWEKGARGTDERTFSWGDSLTKGNQANFCDVRCAEDWKYVGADDGYERTAPVGNYPDGASPYGVLDMTGNVWEWVADWHDANYYSKSPSRNPLGPDSGEKRVVRGGSWYGDPHHERCAVRLGIYPGDRIKDVGFRCAKDYP